MPPVDEVVETTVSLTPEQLTEAEAAEDAAMTASYAEAAPTETPVPTPADPAPVETTPDPTPVPATPAEPDLTAKADITVGQLHDLMKAAAAMETLKDSLTRQVGGVHGKMGGLERTIKELQAQTPAGQSLELKPEHFEEMQKDFPDLVDMTVKGFNRALKASNVKGTAPAATPEPIDIQAQVREGIQAVMPEVIQTAEETATKRMMRSIRPDWETVVHSPDYLAWLKTQPAEYHDKIQNSWEIADVKESIEKFDAFKQQQAAPKPKTPVVPEKPKGRFAAAVQPKSAGGGTGTAVATEDDALLAGFKQARNQ